jgi:two-component system, chemotaxis family, protein-glutamate methylesterase/glutaminase
MLKKIKVLIIDDSAIVRDILKKGLSLDPLIDVVGTAADVYSARDRIVYLKPDVLTLDIQMPRMNGIEFLKYLMPQYPVPVIIVSSISKSGARETLDALELGAVDFVLKPSNQLDIAVPEMIYELRKKIIAASKVDVSGWKKPLQRNRSNTTNENPDKYIKSSQEQEKIIVIGASTGGTKAVSEIIMKYNIKMPGTIIVQHMPPVFTRLFAEKLNEVSKAEVKEAATGDIVDRGRVLIAPGGLHIKIVRSENRYIVKCGKSEKVNGHCPSVDVLFDSVAATAGKNAIGIILTGMGKDGASGLLKMRNAGARTMAQDRKSSVIFGMPYEAYICGGAEKYVSLDNIFNSIVNILKVMK